MDVFLHFFSALPTSSIEIGGASLKWVGGGGGGEFMGGKKWVIRAWLSCSGVVAAGNEGRVSASFGFFMSWIAHRSLLSAFWTNRFQCLDLAFLIASK